MLEFHSLFYKTNEQGPLSVENDGVPKGLTCHSPPVHIGVPYQKRNGLSEQSSVTVTLPRQLWKMCDFFFINMICHHIEH